MGSTIHPSTHFPLKDGRAAPTAALMSRGAAWNGHRDWSRWSRTPQPAVNKRRKSGANQSKSHMRQENKAQVRGAWQEACVCATSKHQSKRTAKSCQGEEKRGGEREPGSGTFHENLGEALLLADHALVRSVIRQVALVDGERPLGAHAFKHVPGEGERERGREREREREVGS